jgi:hypothetical protein
MRGRIYMTKKYLAHVFIFFALYVSGILDFQSVQAQVTGPQEIKWIWVSSIRQWFSNGGAEIEYGRRGRQFLNTDQIDGLRWPAEYPFQDHNVGQSVWIGTTNFTQTVGGVPILYPNKVVCSGRLFMYLDSEIFPAEITLVAQSQRPDVFVDDNRASDLESYDEVDLIDTSIPADRVIVNIYHTPIGITVTRKVYAFTQQYHNNYHIYEYVFKNTGIVDNLGTVIARDLTGVVFHFQYRLANAYEAFRGGWAASGSSWGLNTINDAVGQDAAHLLTAPNDFRAVFSYYGPCSGTPGIQEDIGGPNHTNGFLMAGTHFMGSVVLHADRSADDPTDDFSQPTTTQFMGSDRDAQAVDQYNSTLMTQKYGFMTAGHPAQTHAEQVGKDANGWPTRFSNTWGGDPGGYSAAQGFGPYDLDSGDSIRIVLAECFAGINRQLNKEITRKWFTNTGPFILPDGNTTADRNEYKNKWVFTGKDSLFQTFRRALANYNNNYQIPAPPAPPDKFVVSSGGNRISLSWSSSAEGPGFNGYNLYRAEGRPDTTYDLIFTCTAATNANLFEDRTAKRGFNYYYYIQTKDDGSTNNIETNVPLVSSKFYTMTNLEAFLTRAPSPNLTEIRVVPNPYNIKSKDLQFGQDSPDRLAFYGLPPYCSIKIFTENGDLIQSIDHTDGSGDELWDSLTSSNQLVVSGLYIAYFEVSRDTYENNKLIFKKGDNAFRKFIIIR